MYRTFAEAFREALSEAKLSQTAFSVKYGFPKNAVWEYYNGYTVPLEKRKREIAIALGKPEEYFLEYGIGKEKQIIKKVKKEEKKTRPSDSLLKWGQVGGIGSKIKGVK